MTLVRLAIGRRASGALAYINLPVSRSASTAATAVTSGVAVRSFGVARTDGNGEREPCGGTGVGGGPLAAVANPAEAIPTRDPATTSDAMRRAPRVGLGLTRPADDPAAWCGATLA